MMDQTKRPGDLIPTLLALAAKLEGEGYLNNAKLLRASVESISREAAYQIALPASKSELLISMRLAIDELSASGLNPNLIQALKLGADAMESGRLPLIQEIPDIYVCRTCGYLVLNHPQVNCPTCNSRPGTFKHFPAVYWLDALEPFEALELLRQTPEEVSDMLIGLSDEKLKQIPEDGGWSIHNAVSHLRDSQGVLDMRVNLMLTEDNPRLESKAVFEWAEQSGELPETTMEIFKTYELSRRSTIARLESLQLSDWRRTGKHEEFGGLTIQQQVSYFSIHELIHLPQIDLLVRG